MVDWAKELAPAVTRVGFLFNPTTAPGGGSYFLRRFEAAAPSFQVQPIAIPVETPADIERALASLGAGGNSGLIVNSDIFAARNRAAIIAAAARQRVPAIYPFVLFTLRGVSLRCDDWSAIRARADSRKDVCVAAWRKAAALMRRPAAG